MIDSRSESATAQSSKRWLELFEKRESSLRPRALLLTAEEAVGRYFLESSTTFSQL
ncbi:hypothetical protein [Pirellula sp. SH-Sr6A]|uniref:hypothetical protein n=1 Tax=Pirellula sp. SH-Sr6A TaxID=1632865 RepID=UPI001438761D|nr:hypothetical protein [Pirellula sp. SH-Sr6A]